VTTVNPQENKTAGLGDKQTRLTRYGFRMGRGNVVCASRLLQ